MSASDEHTMPLLLVDHLVGTQVGEYQVLSPIGEGGMGVVYEGRQPVIQKRVAIKVLKPHVATDEAHVRRLIAEARAVNAVGHRNIIDIFSLGRLADGRPYLVMEFLVGKPLDVCLEAAGTMSLSDAVSLLIEVCDPLAAAHRAGVIHRDLKPSNVFLCTQPDGGRFLKLLDFGLAKQASSGRSEVTANSQIAGTPLYMSPEQARSVQTSFKTDIYSLGVIGYQLVTGKVPFRGETPMDVMIQHVQAPVPSALAANPSVPAELDALLRRMMAKTEAERPESIDDVRRALTQINVNMALAQGVTGPGRALATDEVLQHDAPRPRQRKSRTLLAALGVSMLVGAAGAAGFALRSPKATVEAVDVKPVVEPVVVKPAVEPTAAPAVVVKPVVETPEALPAVEPVGVPPPVVKPALVEHVTPKPLAQTTAIVKPSKPAEPKATATSDQLIQRLKQLEQRLRAATPGEDPDPSALAFLSKYKAEAMMAQSPEDRVTVTKKLDDFERSFLGQ